jgi:hypothetical protein
MVEKLRSLPGRNKLPRFIPPWVEAGAELMNEICPELVASGEK